MEPCFVPGRILLPQENIPVSQWACLACDQFTSQPDYWEQAAALAAGGPSALNIVLPEVYLDKVDTPTRIRAIHETMERYRAGVLTRCVNGFVYVERTQTDGKVRQGLVGLIDLEQYDWRPGMSPAVRPTEGTVPSRIPPRLAVRNGASLESPHILMLADDAGRTLVEPVAAQKDRLPLLYEGELALGGGFVRGWAVEDPALLKGVEEALAALGSQKAFDEKYPQAAGAPPMTLAVGDGNHSLATAKAYWEELKPGLTEEQRAVHPARWCLAEVCNVHSPAIEIEPIHRVVFGSIERFIGILIEHFAGAFPLWLSPVQAVVLPISEHHHEYAQGVQDVLEEAGFRVECDLRNEKIGYKIREAQLQRTPYMIVVGDKEAAEGTISVRHRADGDLGSMDLPAFIAKLKEEVESKEIK